MSTRLHQFPATVLALFAAFVWCATAAPTYTVTDLGDTYRVNGFQGKVVNDKGEVIGSELGPTGASFLYSAGSWHSLGHLNTSGMGNTATTARGLNSASLVVGDGDTGRVNGALEQTDAFFINGTGGTLTPLGLVSGANSNQVAIAHACNDLGAVVGNVIDHGAGTRDTFIYVPGTGITARTGDGVYSFAINRYGDVLGTALGLPPQPVLNGVPLRAATAGFNARAINNAGQILLSVDDVHPLAAGWGLIYDYATGKTTALGNLHPQSAGYTAFLDFNDWGHVVGRGSDETLAPHAVLYTPEDGLISLHALGLTAGGQPIHLTEAHGINNVGQIACVGYTNDPNDAHAFLLTPDASPSLPMVAAYDGLASVGGVNVGAVAIAISKTNIATVKLRSGSLAYSFKITLTNGGFSGPPFAVKGVSLTVALQADAKHQTITGTIDDGTNTYAVTALHQTKLGIFAGNYTALLLSPAQGRGYGQMKVTKTGAVVVKGQLGDGSPYTAAALLHYDGTWTFYAPLYLKAAQPGTIAGSIAFNRAATDSDSAGSLFWSSPGNFTTNVDFKGAFFKPAKGVQVLKFTNPTNGTAAFAFSGGGQALPPHTLSVTDKNDVTVTDPGADELAVKISGAKGALTGSFLPASGAKKVSFNGVMQQKLNLGAGVFVNAGTGGSVLLTPQ